MLDVKSEVGELVRDVVSGLDEVAAEFVPWFYEQMPESYFRNTDPATRLEHLRAILALRASGQDPWMRIRSNDGRRVTYLLPSDYPGMLVSLLRDFGHELIRSAKLYSSKDNRLVIDIFDLGQSPRVDLNDSEASRKFEATLELARERGANWTEAALREHFGRLSQDYVRECPPARMLTHADLVRKVQASAGSEVLLDNSKYPGYSRVVYAVSNAPAKRMLIRVARRFATARLNMIRTYVDAIQAGEEESAVIISAVVQGPEGGPIDPESTYWKRLRRDLLRLKWVNRVTMDLGLKQPKLGLGGADILHTYCDLVHQVLVKTNRYVYSRSRIRDIAEQHVGISTELVDLFRDRFDPDGPLDDADYHLRENKLRDRISTEIEDEVAHTVLSTILRAIGMTLKTNYYVAERYALALRVEPELLVSTDTRPEMPFGVFFVHGRDFNGFHVRFRDIARGGVRVVRPGSEEQYVRESERHFDEVYDLAHAQQLKNKDIPEGGAKAVVLVRPEQTIKRCVRAFTDSILDLITTDPKTRRLIVDRFGRQEFIYLGPDENITPEHIIWMANRAAVRGYPFPNAFISSKPGAGINHKEYGVTSEGVNVFLEIALKAIGIDPRKQPFSVKLTGGPDGDVAGNEIKILIREYGPNVKIVGIADGFGCAEDPEGLDHQEMLRLVHESKPISAFNPKRLSPRGKLTLVTDADGVRLRNEMHNRVISDAFVPAGGRPATINGSNWQRFITSSGRPSSRLIVEGANVFITPEARDRLFESGVMLVKDSSANKCGVICSSYEILASLMIDEREFIEIKRPFVEQVLARLREAARLEAELLFEEHNRRPSVPLHKLSIALSREINRLTDAIYADYETLERLNPEIVRETVVSYIPPVLREKAGDRIWTKLPEGYRRHIVCAALASRIVYQEGLDYFRDTPDQHLAELALRYVQRDRRTKDLVEEVVASGLAEREEIARLLRIGGTRAGLRDAAR